MRKEPSGEKNFFWTHGHKICPWDLLAWKQYTRLRYYYKNQAKRQKRDHLDALERRLQLCEKREIKSLLLEPETLQQMLKSNKDPKNIADVSKIFSKLMGKQNINGTLKLFTNNMTNDIFG